jgi:hypothetical protein
MKRVFFGLATILIVFTLLTADRVSSQENANVQIGTRPIRQGDVVKFIVDLDKAANVSGGIFIKVAPTDDLTKPLEFNVGINAGVKKAEVYGGIPLEAPIGTWKGTGLSFHGDGLVQQLEVSGKLTFQVSRHEPLILPSSATVRIE